MNIKNYVKVSDNIHTSGQPKENEFQSIADLGVETVINLAMPDSDAAIKNEGELVTQLGMSYIHIPVVWDEPKIEQFELFSTIMQRHIDKKIWIHCALNWRVSSFIYLYRTKYLGVSEAEAKETLTSIWEPNDVWSEFIANNA